MAALAARTPRYTIAIIDDDRAVVVRAAACLARYAMQKGSEPVHVPTPYRASAGNWCCLLDVTVRLGIGRPLVV